MLGFLLFLFLIIGGYVGIKWGYAKLTTPCGCKEVTP